MLWGFSNLCFRSLGQSSNITRRWTCSLSVAGTSQSSSSRCSAPQLGVGQTQRLDRAVESHHIPDQDHPHNHLLGSESVRGIRAVQRSCGPHHDLDLGRGWAATGRECCLGGLGLDMPTDDLGRAPRRTAGVRD